MTHGHFSPDGREYILTDPCTPRPWHNYLFNDVYLANLTQHATGASFYQPTSEGLRANVLEDRDGNGGPRFVYLRDRDSGQHWSLTGAPDFMPMEDWQCRIGLGYQINTSRLHSIRAQWRAFVPRTDDPCEIWTVSVTNEDSRPRRISLFPYLEMHLTGGSTLMDFISVLGGRYVPEWRAVLGINRCVKFPDHFKAVLAADQEVAAATVSRDAFLGPYRDYHAPLAVTGGETHNPQAGTEWLGASLRMDLELAPGETWTGNFAVAVFRQEQDVPDLLQRTLSPGTPETLFQALSKETTQLCEQIQVHTGDEQFDRWMNIWLKHQLAFVARWGRVIGRGFRDILQDIFGHRMTEPARARACLKEVFARQFPSGKCIRAWRLPTAILDLQDYADSPSWMIMALALYLKETADFALLEESVPFLNAEDPYAAPLEQATMWEHVLLAQRYLLRERGRHGLSKIYYGDWCDTLNGVGARGRGESVMLSMQVKWGCDLMAELAEAVHKPDIAEEMRKASAELTQAIDQTSWDGEWYLRAFDDDALPIGTSQPPASDEGEGRIFLNPQSWALIAGIGSESRRQTAVQSAARMLDTGYGMVLNDPPYTALRPRIGQMTAMSPGFYENASVYVHGNCFWIFGLAMAGFTEEAIHAFRAILPDTANKPLADTEPFVIPNYYIGPVAERRKQKNLYLSGWRTGSAAWLFLTGLEWFLGARAEYAGLRIDPHLPAEWSSVRVVRPFRGDTYEILIRRKTPQANRVTEILLDGRNLDGSLIPPAGDGKRHRVEVLLA